MSDIEVLLFDLGGVLLALNDPAETFGVSTDEEAFLHHWISSQAVRDFERGAIDPQTFAQRIVDEADLPYGWQAFLARFDTWPDRLFPGITELLDRIPARYRRALLSNTNEGHWRQAGVADALEHRFDKVFLSYRTGRLKPDPEAFMQVFSAYRCAPERVVFFDDNPANVAAAREIGCQAKLTKGVDELRASLTRLGIPLG